MNITDLNSSCDIVVGFSLDMIVDFINCNSSEIVIDRTSINEISKFYRYAFQNYFQTDEDKIIVHLPYAISAIDDQHIEAVSKGIVSWRGGAESYFLKCSHHYTVKYNMPNPDCRGAIQLEYEGAEVKILNDRKLEAIPTKLVRQSVQSKMKSFKGFKIYLDPPSINIPFADLAVSFNRLTLHDRNKGFTDRQLIFETDINGDKSAIGGFDFAGKKSVDLSSKHIIKGAGKPLTLAAQGVYISSGGRTVNPLGAASNSHFSLGKSALSCSLVGRNPECDWELYRDFINAKVGCVYRSVEAVVNPVFNKLGYQIKNYNDTVTTVTEAIKEPLAPALPNYTLEYEARKLKPINVSTEYAGFVINHETNSMCIKFNFGIDGISDGSSDMSGAFNFVYPYGLGVIASRNFLNKVFRAHWNYSYDLPKSVCMDFNETVFPQKGKAGHFYSATLTSAELFINSGKIYISASMSGVAQSHLADIAGAGNKGGSVASINFSEKLLAETELNISKDSGLAFRIKKLSFEENAERSERSNNLAAPVYKKLSETYKDVRINILNLPAMFSIDGRDFNLEYESASLGNDTAMVSSCIKGLKQAGAGSIPLLPVRKVPATILPVPKDKWGGEGTAPGMFNAPCGISLVNLDDGGFIFVTDRDNNRAQKFDLTGEFMVEFGNRGEEAERLSYPTDVAADMAGNVYVVDVWNHMIQKFDSNGNSLSKWGANGKGKGRFTLPQGVAVDEAGNVYVTDGNNLVQKFNSLGKFLKQWGGPGSANGKFNSPKGITFGKNGFFYVVDTGNNRIQKFSGKGKFITKWGQKGSGDGEFCSPQGIVVDSIGNVYVTDTGNNRIQKFDNDGVFIAKIGSEGSLSGQVFAPMGIAVDDEDCIYVAEAFNHRVQKFGI